MILEGVESAPPGVEPLRRLLWYWQALWLTSAPVRWYRRLKAETPALCPPTVTDRARIDRLRQGVYSPRRERFHEVRCLHCGRRWLANQHHRATAFSCGDAVRPSDYGRI